MMWIVVDRKSEKMTTARSLLVLTAVVLLQSALIEGRTSPNGAFHYLCPTYEDPNNPTHLQYQGDCRKFIKCSYGKAYVLSCPRGQHWSVTLDRCEAVTVAKCDATATSPAPSIGGGGCHYTYSPLDGSCDSGSMCVNGNDIPLDCSPGFYWDRTENKCKFGECPYDG